MSCEISGVHQYHPVFVEIAPRGSATVPPEDTNNNISLLCHNVYSNLYTNSEVGEFSQRMRTAELGCFCLTLV